MPLYPNVDARGLINPVQTASGLMQALFLALNYSADDKAKESVPHALMHFHDDSSSQIAWNDVQAILLYNQANNTNLPVPLTASQAYSQHYHSSPYDGGFVPGRGVHDHRDNNNGGLAFACYHPGTSLPQQPFVL